MLLSVPMSWMLLSPLLLLMHLLMTIVDSPSQLLRCYCRLCFLCLVLVLAMMAFLLSGFFN